jgi:hypothetical protein
MNRLVEWRIQRLGGENDDLRSHLRAVGADHISRGAGIASSLLKSDQIL